jgi:hypothetical protein
VIGYPGTAAGAVKDTIAERTPGIADTPVGAAGTLGVVTALEAADAGPVPIAFVALTVIVYVVLLSNPVIVNGLAGPVTALLGLPVDAAVAV